MKEALFKGLELHSLRVQFNSEDRFFLLLLDDQPWSLYSFGH